MKATSRKGFAQLKPLGWLSLLILMVAFLFVGRLLAQELGFNRTASLTVQFSFNAQTNAYYQIWASKSLTGEWDLIRGMMLGTNGLLVWEESNPQSFQSLFYRAVSVPLADSGDADGDGLSDVYELQHPSFSPLNPDSDGDGILDGDEIGTVMYGFGGDEPPDLLRNPGFETPVGTTDFSGTDWSSGWSGSAGREWWAARSGVRGGYFPGWRTDISEAGIWQDVSATGGTYTFSMWIRQEEGFNPEVTDLKLEWYDSMGASWSNAIQAPAFRQGVSLPSDRGWHSVFVTGMCTGRNLACVRPLFHSQWAAPNPGNSAVMFDDAALYLGPYRGVSSLANAGFEDNFATSYRLGWYAIPEGGVVTCETWAARSGSQGIVLQGWVGTSNSYTLTLAQNLTPGTGTYTFSVWMLREENFLLTNAQLSLQYFDSSYTNKVQSDTVTNLDVPNDRLWHNYSTVGSCDNTNLFEVRATVFAQWLYNPDPVDWRALKLDDAQFSVGDADGDGLPDWWEVQYSGDATKLFPTADEEPDGLNNLQEYQADCNPFDADTDHDGQEDGYEVSHGSSPTDAASFVSSACGTVSYAGSQTGVIWVVATPTNDENRVIALNGSNAYLNCGASPVLNLTTALTIEAWIRVNSVDEWDGIVTKGTVSGSPYTLNFAPGGRLRWLMGWSDGWGWWDSSRAIATGHWEHVAVTYDGSELSMYVNGQKDPVGCFTNITINPSSEPLILGCDLAGDQEYFDGLMDEVRIWNRGLSGLELRENMWHKLSGAEPGLVAYWTFDNGTTRDLTTNSSDGNMVGDGILLSTRIENFPSTRCWIGSPDPFCITNLPTLVPYRVGAFLDVNENACWDVAEAVGAYSANPLFLTNHQDAVDIILGDDPAADSDGDGLSNGDEIDIWHTDPSNADTDCDGMPDGWEVVHGLNPLDSIDRLSDADDDEFAAICEWMFHTDPSDSNSVPERIVIGVVDDGGIVHECHLQGDGTFSPLVVIASIGGCAQGIRVGDFDSDGTQDIIACSTYVQPHFIKGNGDGSFQTPRALAAISNASEWSIGTAAGDFDCDGNLDFVAGDELGNAGFYWGEGDGTFTLAQSILPANQRGMDAGDFNEDGLDDVVRATYPDGVVRLYLSNGNRTFSEEAAPVGDAGDDPYGIAAGDFDEDGHLDVLAHSGGIGTVTLFRGNGDGTFQTGEVLPELDIHYYGGLDGYDLNGDGHLDSLLLDFQARTLRYYLGEGNGSFGGYVTVSNQTPNAALGLSAPPLPPRVDIEISPKRPAIVLGASLALSTTGRGVSSNDVITWTFGDGNTAQGHVVTNLYAAEGVFVARLTHTSTSGVRSCRGTCITVRGKPPVANAGGPYSSGEGAASDGQWTAALDGSSSTDDFGIVSYIWDFGDGTLLTNGPLVSHTWSAGGTWTAQLTVVDSAGLEGSDQTAISLRPGQPPVAAIDGPVLVDEHSATNGYWHAAFSATNSADDYGIWRYEWDFGNGYRASGPSASMLYGETGTFHVALTVVDHAGQSNTATHVVSVVANERPVASISGPDTLRENSATGGLWYGEWSSTGSTDDVAIWRYEWNFGDDSSVATGSSVAHYYNGAGNYELTLTVFDHGNQTSTTRRTVTTVGDAIPVARVTATPQPTEGSQPVTLSGRESTDDYGIYLYHWDLPSRLFTFLGTRIDESEWTVGTNVAQNERLVVTGSVGWGMSYVYTRKAKLPRGNAVEFRIDTPAQPAQSAMAGLRNFEPSGYYMALLYGIYFYDGSLRVYENGNDRGSFGTYTPGDSCDVRIETKFGGGARYYVRTSGSGSGYSLLYDSDYETDSAFCFGADVSYGVFGFDDIQFERTWEEGEEVTIAGRSGTAYLSAIDHALQTGRTEFVLSSVTGTVPAAVIEGPTNGSVGTDLLFDGYRSTDDFAIASYAWDFGDGSEPGYGRTLSHFYSMTGTYAVVLTVTDYADQSEVITQLVHIAGEPPVVAVPWHIVGEVEIPHETWSGHEITLKAAAGHTPIPFDYTWDFGDGSPPSSGSVTSTVDAYCLGARHAYTGTVGTLFTATVTIVFGNGQQSSDTYPVIIRPSGLDVEIDVAVDEGLWYLHKTQTRLDLDEYNRAGYWESYISISGKSYVDGSSASAVQAFEVNGHVGTGDASQDPYVETVKRGANYLLTRLATLDLTMLPSGNPDSNGNGIGLSVPSDRPIYELGQVMDMLVAGGRPDTVAQVGAVNVKGRRLAELVQDMMDTYVWGQSAGGWRYGWRSDRDNSACQWAAVGMLAAERYLGLKPPSWTKTANREWLEYSKGNLGFGYTEAGNGEATTPSALIQLAWQGASKSDPLWRHGESFLASYWQELMDTTNLYSYYAIAKAMRLANPEPVLTLAATGKDWFLDPSNGLARVILSLQDPTNSSWCGSSTRGYIDDPKYSTAWCVLILTSSMLYQGPIAVIEADPNPAAVGQTVVFDATQSFHQDPTFRIVEYRWDFDASDGMNFDTPDEIGPVVQHAFGSLGPYTVALQVRDNNTPSAHDTATINFQITKPPHKPTADAGGPYVSAVGEPIHLDGSGSFDVDEPDGDFVRSWSWEVDGLQPYDFDDGVVGRTPIYAAGFSTPGEKTVGLRVTDMTVATYPDSGSADLTDDDFANVIVYSRLLTNLQARTKADKCQLTWTPEGDELVICRSEISPNEGFEEIGRVPGNCWTFLDTNIDLSIEYYYRIYVYRTGIADPLGVSPAVYAYSRDRGDLNRRPHFTSIPIRAAKTGQLYLYDAQASDREGDSLTFSLTNGPSGMTIDSANGVVRFIPALSQVGTHSVSLEVRDALGKDVQNYELVVFPTTNNKPIAEANGPYSSLPNEPIGFSSEGSLDADGETLNYAWNFGDGGTSSDANPSHVYTADGEYIATLFVNDGAGGTASDQARVRVERPNRNPTAVVSNGPSFLLRLGETLCLNGSGSTDLDGDHLTFQWEWGDGTLDGNAASSLCHTYLAEGSYTGRLVVADGRGGEGSSEFVVTVAARNQPPAALFTMTQGGTNIGDRFTFDASATSDPDGDPLSFTWDFGDKSQTTGIGVTHVFREAGNFSVTLTVLDTHGGTGTASCAVNLNHPPVFTSTPPARLDQGALFNYQPAAVDPDGDGVSYELVEGPVGMELVSSGGPLMWTPGNEMVGEHAVRVRATDPHGGVAEQTFTVTVFNVNDPPVIFTTPVTNAGLGTLYTYAVHANDPDGDEIFYSLDNWPVGMTIDPSTGLIEWTPTPAQAGSNLVVVEAEDINGALDTQSFTVVTFAASHVPTALAESNQTVFTGNRVSFDGSASSDPDGDPLSYRWTVVSRPRGSQAMLADSNNVSCSLVVDRPGTYIIELVVSDGVLSSSPDNVTVTAEGNAPLDLAPTLFDASGVTVDSRTLSVSGSVQIEVANFGLGTSDESDKIVVFEDADFNHAYSPGVDPVVGEYTFASLPLPGSYQGVYMTVSGKALFRDNPLYVFVDSPDTVAETNENNNVRNSTADCATNNPPCLDISASFLRVGRAGLPGVATLTARLGNAGGIPTTSTVAMAFYDGQPQNGGVLIGVVRTTNALEAGRFVDLAVNWITPSLATHHLYVVADDAGTGVGQYAETREDNNVLDLPVDLRVNDAPTANAGPDQQAYTGYGIALDGSGSSDPQGDALTYHWSFFSIPLNSSASLQGTNTPAPIFTADVPGSYVIQLMVNDGTLDSQPDTVTVTAREFQPNHTPVVNTNPPPAGWGMVGVPYTYQVNAADPDGDTLTYQATQCPEGMTINETNGYLTWTPTQFGGYPVNLVVRDNRGAIVVMAYVVTVYEYEEVAPVITSTPPGTTEPNVTYSYDVEATDMNGQPLVFSLSQAPAAMTIDAQSGLIQWVPSSGQMGGHEVTVVVSDPTGLTATQNFCVVVVQNSASSPAVTPIPDQAVEEPATFAQIHLDDYVSDPDHADSQLTWSISGNAELNVQINASRVATITYAPGVRVSERITFLATDPNGYSGFATARFTVKGADQPPVAAIANLATEYSVDGITTLRDGVFELMGAADDPDAGDDVSYRISLFDTDGKLVADMTPQPLNRYGYREGRVTATGLLAKLDFTLIRNGTYDLYLDVMGGDKIATAWVPIALDSQLKVGHFTFSQQDIVIPVHGIPLTVIRTYDSLNPDAGDFGYSWTYSIADMEMAIDEVRTPAEDVFGERFSMRSGGGRDLTLTLPDGRRVTFVFELRRAVNADCPECSSFMYRAVWRAPVGVYATLEPTCSDKLITLPYGLTYWEAAGPETPMDWFDFPGFILTMKDGTKYQIDRENLGEHFIDTGTAGSCFVTAYGDGMLTRIDNLNSDRVEFVRSGVLLDRVDHYNALGEKTKSLVFNRDVQGRFVAIYDPACLDTNGNPVGPASMTYEYDAAGNLSKVNKLTDKSNPTNPVYLTTTFVYGNPAFPHYITAIQDPRGVTPMRNEYDEDGRLVATIDAFGHRITYDHDLAARTETIYDRLGNATIHAYDNRGNIIATTDPLGHTTTRTYDDAGNETSVTDPLGHTTRRAYDPAGNLLSVTGPMTNTTTYTYDEMGNILTVTDPLGNASSNEYDAAGNLIAAFDALGQEQAFAYDSAGNVIRVVDVASNVARQMGYDSAGNMTTAIDAAGLVRQYGFDDRAHQTSRGYTWVNPENPDQVRDVVSRTEYDNADQIVRIVRPDGTTSTMDYAESGELVAITDGSGRQIRMHYDGAGNIIETVFADGARLRKVCDADGREVLTTARYADPEEVWGTRNVYDPVGRVILRERRRGLVVGIVTQDGAVVSSVMSLGTVVSSNSLTYDAAGRLIAETNEDGGETRFEYDAAGHNVACTDALGHRTDFVYDGAGHQILARDAAGSETQYDYDALGRAIQTVYEDGSVATNEYSAVGKLIAETDQAGKTRDFEYDAAGRLTAVVLPPVPDPENGSAPTRPRFDYGYDIYGNLLMIRDPKGRVTRFTYDYLNRLTSRCLPMGQTEHRSYNVLGQLQRLTDFKGQVTEYVYDNLGRVSEKRLYETGADTPAQVISFAYDELGRQKRIVEARGTTEFSYDEENRVTSIASPEGTINYEYDRATGRKTRTWTANTDTRYGYDEIGRLKTVTLVKRNGELLSEPEVTTYNYTAVGSRGSMELPNGITTSYEYDSLNRLTNLFHQSSSGQLLASYAYTLAPDGRRVGVTELTREADAITTNRIAYTYDDLNRLTREITSLYTSEYEYDLVGNRLERTVQVGGQALQTAYGYNDNDQLLGETNSLTTVAVSGGGGNQSAGSLVPHRPSPWSFYTYVGLIGCILLAGVVPVLPKLRVLPVNILSSLSVSFCVLCGSPHSLRLFAAIPPVPVFRRRSTLTLFTRSIASMLTAVMLVGPVVTETLADGAAEYAGLTTETWGKDGTTTTYTYDANGSCTSKTTVDLGQQTLDSAVYAYNLENRLAGASIHRQEGTDDVVIDAAYTYDQSGIRVGSEVIRTINGQPTTDNTLFLNDPQNHTGYSQVIEELSAFGTRPKVSYTIGDDIISQSTQVSGFSPQHFLYDGHGSTRLLADNFGSVVEGYSFDVYGIMTQGDGMSALTRSTALIYSGELFDSALDSQYLRQRYYAQSSGRFISADPALRDVIEPANLHSYAYASDDPVNATDPSGMFTLIEITLSMTTRMSLETIRADYSVMLVKTFLQAGHISYAVIQPGCLLQEIGIASMFKNTSIGIELYFKGRALMRMGIRAMAQTIAQNYIDYGKTLMKESLTPRLSFVATFMEKEYGYITYNECFAAIGEWVGIAQELGTLVKTITKMVGDWENMGTVEQWDSLSLVAEAIIGKIDAGPPLNIDFDFGKIGEVEWVEPE